MHIIQTILTISYNKNLSTYFLQTCLIQLCFVNNFDGNLKQNNLLTSNLILKNYYNTRIGIRYKIKNK